MAVGGRGGREGGRANFRFSSSSNQAVAVFTGKQAKAAGGLGNRPATTSLHHDARRLPAFCQLRMRCRQSRSQRGRNAYLKPACITLSSPPRWSLVVGHMLLLSTIPPLAVWQSRLHVPRLCRGSPQAKARTVALLVLWLGFPPPTPRRGCCSCCFCSCS